MGWKSPTIEVEIETLERVSGDLRRIAEDLDSEISRISSFNVPPFLYDARREILAEADRLDRAIADGKLRVSKPGALR